MKDCGGENALIITAPIQIVTAPAQLITAPAQPPLTGVALYIYSLVH